MSRALILALLSCFVLLAACGSDASLGRIAFTLSLPNLESFSVTGVRFQGWALVSGQPVSTGQFVLDASVTPKRVLSPSGVLYGTTTAATFGPSNTGLGQSFPFILNATAFFVTIEPAGIDDGVPDGSVLMAGTFNGATCALSAAGVAQGAQAWTLGDWTAASGVVTLESPTNGTPTNGTPTNGNANLASGMWFEIPGAPALPGLSLPAVQGSWRLQSWVSNSATGDTYSTGQFSAASGPDRDFQSAATRGALNVGPLFPGQDFVTTVNTTTPILDLADGTWEARITAEPDVDNAQAPFPLTLLSAPLPSSAVNAAGASAADVVLTSSFAALPQVSMQITGATAAGFAGTALVSLGAERDGEYALWVYLQTATDPQLVCRLRVTGSVVSNPQSLQLLGTTTTFSINAVSSGLGPNFPNLQQAVSAFMTVEAQGGPLSVGGALQPSGATLLAGTVLSNAATLTVAGLTAQGGIGLANFSTLAGSCILAAPTANTPVGGPAVERNGIWFVTLLGRMPSLVMPALPAGWVYEGWVRNTVSGVQYSTGRFRSAVAADDDAALGIGAGPLPGYSAPGRDFLNPVTVAIPALPQLNAGTWSVLVTLQPLGADAVAPSPWGVLTGSLPALVNTPSAALLNLAASLPGGSVSRL